MASPSVSRNRAWVAMRGAGKRPGDGLADPLPAALRLRRTMPTRRAGRSGDGDDGVGGGHGGMIAETRSPPGGGLRWLRRGPYQAFAGSSA